MDTIFMFSLVIAGFVTLMIWSIKQHQKRQAELIAWAEGRNWQFAKEDKSLLRRWQVAPFIAGRGNSPSAKQVMWGPVTTSRGQTRQALTFNFTYEVQSGSGDDSSTTTYPHHITCVFLGKTTPILELSPEGIGSRIAKAFGGQDIQFESEDFNKRWRVKADDLRFAHGVIHPQMMEHLMLPHHAGVRLALAGDCVMIHNNRRLELAAVDPMLAICNDVIDRIPAYVLDDHS